MRYLTAILFGLLAAGCGDKAADNLMTQASVLIEEHPDSALLALRQIDPRPFHRRPTPGGACCSRKPTPAQVPRLTTIR